PCSNEPDLVRVAETAFPMNNSIEKILSRLSNITILSSSGPLPLYQDAYQKTENNYACFQHCRVV
ncbi:MAG: hypothetical protein LBU18_02285, partial [Treponema sp.]|nr:hypothetical protein [Treponema sp.]